MSWALHFFFLLSWRNFLFCVVFSSVFSVTKRRKMLGTGLQFGTVRGEDRFYIHVKARKSNQNQQKQARRAMKSDKSESPDSSTKTQVMDSSEDRNSTQPSEPSITPSSNLERLLESTTPFVPAQYFSKVDAPLSLQLVSCTFLVCLVAKKIHVTILYFSIVRTWKDWIFDLNEADIRP